MNWFLAYITIFRPVASWHQNSRHFFELDGATQWDLYTRAEPTFDIWNHAVGSGPRPKTKDQCYHRQHIQRFFLKPFCTCGSALAIKDRGFLNLKPS